MDITTDQTDPQHSRLTLSGRFDAFEAEGFREAADTQLEGSASSLTVVLADVIFIDSSGLAELVRLMKHCRESNGELYLEAPSDSVRVILELTRLDAAFEITTT